MSRIGGGIKDVMIGPGAEGLTGPQRSSAFKHSIARTLMTGNPVGSGQIPQQLQQGARDTRFEAYLQGEMQKAQQSGDTQRIGEIESAMARRPNLPLPTYRTVNQPGQQAQLHRSTSEGLQPVAEPYQRARAYGQPTANQDRLDGQRRGARREFQKMTPQQRRTLKWQTPERYRDAVAKLFGESQDDYYEYLDSVGQKRGAAAETAPPAGASEWTEPGTDKLYRKAPNGKWYRQDEDGTYYERDF
jgi:hypothetical protein